MSAHPPKDVILGPEIIARFALYYHHPDGTKDWGPFHHSLKGRVEGQRGHLGKVAPWGTDPAHQWRTDEERELVELFDRMTPSQRRRVGERVEAYTDTQLDVARRFAEMRSKLATSLWPNPETGASQP